MNSPTPHLTALEGGPALSDFRVRALLPRLRAACSRVEGVEARHVHWANSDRTLESGELDKLAALLDATPRGDQAARTLVVVMPRLGTVSPWASKATDIAHNCGLAAVRRIERVTEFRLQLGRSGLLSQREPLSGTERDARQGSLTVRVRKEKLDSLINLVGELVILQAILEQEAKKEASGVFGILSENLARLSADLRDTMAHLDGAGLAAPQIGVPLREVIFGFEANDRYPEAAPVPNTVLINPELTPLSEEEEEAWEGCLSVPGLRGMVPRWKHLRYAGFDELGRRFEHEVEGFHARVVQHECDHLDGILYPMRIRDFSRFGYTDVLQAGQTPEE